MFLADAVGVRAASLCCIELGEVGGDAISPVTWKNLHAPHLKGLGNIRLMYAYLLRFFALISLSLGACFAQMPPTSVVTTPQVRAELVAHAPQGLKAGEPLMLGLLLQHQPGWHTYWLNAGDSGLATQLNWTLPKGMSAGPTVWPTPRMIRVANMVNHGGVLLL